MRCPHGKEVGDPPRALNCPGDETRSPTRWCQCAVDVMAYEDESNDWETRRAGWPAWSWWNRMREP